MSEDFKYQFSFKTRSGNLFNLRSDSEEEAAEQLQVLANLLPTVEGIESTLAAMETVYQVMGPDRGGAPSGGGYSKPASGGGSAPTQSAAPSGGGDGRQCIHGTMNYRTGQGAKGPWKAYFCGAPASTPKAEQCDPQWVR